MAAQQAIEFLQFTAFSFPTHPASLVGIPASLAVQEIKRGGRLTRVFAIECADAVSCLIDQGAIPRQVLLRAQPSSPELLVVRVERGGQSFECKPGEGYDLVATSDGTAVRFAGNCILQPDDSWDLRYLTGR